MTFRTMLRAGVIVTMLPMVGCSGDPNPMASTVPQPRPAVPSTSSQDQTFAQRAAMSDTFEIQSSQMALQKSRSRAVRSYAQTMIDQHQITSQKLTALAPAKGITMATDLDPMMQQKLATLSAATRTFDRTYIADQIAGHRAAAANMQAEINDGSDSDLKALAQETLPMVQDHLRMAQRLR